MEVKQFLKSSLYKNILEIAEYPVDWKNFKNKTVLLTGAGGFIGFYLTLAFLLRNDLYGDNIKVLALVRSKNRAEQKYGELLNREDLSLVVQDVCEPIKSEKADYVIHLASQASNIQFENDPVGTMNANLSGTVNVLEFARKNNAVSLIVSSLKVYGRLETGRDRIFEEDNGYIDQTSYKNCYAVAKRASETLAASYVKQYGMSVKLARPSYIYGASSLDDDRVWANFIANVVKRENILLKSNGATYRSFCYVTDTCTALLTVLLKGENAYPYNISDENSNITIRGFARTATEVFADRNLILSFANKEDEQEPPLYKEGDLTPEVMDSTKLKQLGWKSNVDIKEGIKRAVEILEEQ